MGKVRKNKVSKGNRMHAKGFFDKFDMKSLPQTPERRGARPENILFTHLSDIPDLSFELSKLKSRMKRRSDNNKEDI